MVTQAAFPWNLRDSYSNNIDGMSHHHGPIIWKECRVGCGLTGCSCLCLGFIAESPDLINWLQSPDLKVPSHVMYPPCQNGRRKALSGIAVACVPQATRTLVGTHDKTETEKKD